ncbi:MerR family transcriptional regulator [Candidatus Filomicrobium marinum]|uniref:MerR family transcriptional regulator n=2 Tax=Filomicrobium TaxID=119044 RepID=A0A0D6JHK6_9HYPH|nr:MULTISPECIES: MerR family transcriptional regulator [Filomicrobium]MCV0369681.1 MerR family transcriptional regulator [Filomicrobium sp.]CFX47754.1 MerR family transcriptional regulator [Candidatus Filomicrobium marinum]CPR20500.1 MerR family transcriptional regulator [Candidatus Filomicrobium marinum]SDP15944.1 MerR HTH family regulatory protein [Filomicrobium insigne]
MSKTAQAFRTISEVSDELDVPKHVLRFWELKFPQIKPMKRGGGRRYYRPEDLELLSGIRHLLHAEAYTIKGVQKILREKGVDAVKAAPEGTAIKSDETVPRGKTAKGRVAARGSATAKVATSAGKARGIEPIAMPPGAAKAVEQAIAELKACRALLSQSPESANENAAKPAPARRARRQA